MPTVGNVGGFPANAGRSGGFTPGGVYQGPYGQLGFADVSAATTGPQRITTPPAPPVSTLTDDFTTQDTSKWGGWGGNVSVVSGQLNITCTSSYLNLQSVQQYTLRDSIMTVEIVQLPNLGTGTTSLYFKAIVDGSNDVGIDWQGGVMEAFYTVAGVRNNTSITYNATAHRIWRIRESGGTLYWEASSTGSSWTSLRASIPTPLNLTAISAFFTSGYYGTETTPGTGIYDNFNATYADPPPAPRTLYVDPAGSDSNDGLTTATAWATVSKATNTLLYPGDVVSFKRGGTWTGNLAVTGSGTLANPITVTNYGSGALPIISGGGSSGVAGTINPCQVFGSFVIIDGIEFRGGLKDDVYVLGTDCAIQNCTMRWGSFGVHQDAQAARLDILNNTIADINVGIIGPGTNDDGGGSGVVLEGDSAEVAYNTISGCIYTSPDYGLDGSSIECFGTTNAVVHHNNCSGSPSGMEFGNPPSTTVQNNCTFYDNIVTSNVTAGNGFTIHGALYDDGVTTDIYGPVLGSKVYHNTVYLTGGDSTASGVWVSPSGEVDLQNNIIVVAGNSKMASIGVTSRTITEAGNVFWNTAGNTSNIAINGTTTVDATSTIADPLLVSGTDLRLQPGSPAVDRGLDLGYATDYAGNPRNDGLAPDSGAFEGVVYAYAVTDPVGLVDDQTRVTATALVLTDTAGLTGGQTLDVGRAVTDPAGVVDTTALGLERGVTDVAAATDGQALAVTRQADDVTGLVDSQAVGTGRQYTVDDPAGLTDLPALTVGRAATDTTGITDPAPTQTAAWARQVDDPAGLVDAATISGDWRRAVDDPTSLLDGTALGVGRQVDDQAGSTDTATLTAAWVQTATDAVGLTDAATAAKSGSAALTVDDPAGLVDSTALDVARAVTDSAGSADAVAAGLVVSRQVDDPAGLVDGQALAVGRAVNDQLPATDTAATAAAYSVTATDPAGLTDVALLAASLNLTDPAGLTDGAAAAHGYGMLVTDPTGMVDVLTLAAAWSQALTDTAGVTDTAGAAAAYGRIVDDLLAVADDLTLFAGLLDQPIRVTLAVAAVTAPYRQALAVAGAASSSSVQ